MSYGPFFRTPFTDLAGAVVTHQDHSRCGPLELKFLDCMEAYGVYRGIEKCDAILKDFQECAGANKQIKRVVAMRAERHKQYREGKRSKEDLYAPPPTIDSL